MPFGDDNCPKAIDVSCGDSFTLVLDDYNKVYSFGKGSHGRLGHGNDDSCEYPKVIKTLENERVTSICAG